MVGGRREENWNEEIDEDGGRDANGLWWLRSRAEEIDGEVYDQSDGEICSKGKGKETDEETDEGTYGDSDGDGEICTQNIGERNGKANEKSEPEERRRDLPEWGETLASETRRTRGLVGSEGPEDPGTEGIRVW